MAKRQRDTTLLDLPTAPASLASLPGELWRDVAAWLTHDAVALLALASVSRAHWNASLLALHGWLHGVQERDLPSNLGWMTTGPGEGTIPYFNSAMDFAESLRELAQKPPNEALLYAMLSLLANARADCKPRDVMFRTFSLEHRDRDIARIETAALGDLFYDAVDTEGVCNAQPLLSVPGLRVARQGEHEKADALAYCDALADRTKGIIYRRHLQTMPAWASTRAFCYTIRAEDFALEEPVATDQLHDVVVDGTHLFCRLHPQRLPSNARLILYRSPASLREKLRHLRLYQPAGHDDRRHWGHQQLIAIRNIYVRETGRRVWEPWRAAVVTEK